MVDTSSSLEVHPPRGLAGPPLSVLALKAAEHDVLVVLGEADIATAELLHDLVLQALPDPPRPVLLELGALTFCDSAGLDALRDVARSAQNAGVPLTMRGQSEQLRWLQRTVRSSCRACSHVAPALVELDGRTATAPC